MEAANRDEAKNCLQKAKCALKRGSYVEAEKLARKSVKLCRTVEAEDFLEVLASGTDGVGREDAKPPQRTNGTDTKDSKKGQSQSSDAGDHYKSTSTNFSSEQQDAVQRVLKNSDYYDILEVDKDASDSDLKRQYKRLALALHPDKNSAPKADDAFKAVGKAYSVLSDPTRRNQYDRFGEDGLRTQGVGPEQQDVSPDDIFKMFFGENYSFSSHDRFMYRTGDGGMFVFGDPFRRSRRHHNHRQEGTNTLLHFCQLLPLLLIVFLSLSSSLLQSVFTEPPPFSLYQNRVYSTKRMVEKYKIHYFVMEDFLSKFHDQVGLIEQEVIKEYYSYLTRTCREERFIGKHNGPSCTKMKNLRAHYKGL